MMGYGDEKTIRDTLKFICVGIGVVVAIAMGSNVKENYVKNEEDKTNEIKGENRKGFFKRK